MKIHVIDGMGRSEISASINYINTLPEDERAMFITSDEMIAKRIIDSCPGKKFAMPRRNHNKIAEIKRLLRDGRNIITTADTLPLFDNEMLEFCSTLCYNLFIDKITDIVKPYTELQKNDLELLMNCNYISTHKNFFKLLLWNEDEEYKGVFSDVRTMCMNKSLTIDGDNIYLWLFPKNVLGAFYNTYILMYPGKNHAFNTRNYFREYNRISHGYVYVTGDSIENYTFATEPSRFVE